MLLQEQEHTQLELFASHLPKKPFCSDDLNNGLIIRQAKTAIEKRYIQHNKPTEVAWLAFDCDYAGALEVLGDSHLPPPNIAVVSPNSGRSHLLYGLEVPVHRTAVARAKPLNLLAKIEHSLREGLMSDVGYSGLIVKNPLNVFWNTYELKPLPYDMPELCDWLTLPARLPKRAQTVGLGRNCTLFENLRHWAYREVLTYRIKASYEAFKGAVLAQAIAFNTFPDPLPQSEIRSTAISVAKWTWTKYTGRVSDEEFSATQARRGRLGGLKSGRGRTAEDQEKRDTALKMRSEGHTIKEISDTLDIAYSTIGRWVKK